VFYEKFEASLSVFISGWIYNCFEENGARECRIYSTDATFLKIFLQLANYFYLSLVLKFNN
jgi:hypothetical protein